MKRRILIATALCAIVSCSKVLDTAPATQDAGTGPAIVFHADGLNATVSTKTDAVTSLSSFGVIAEATATPKQEWALASLTKSGSDFLTGKYWPSTDNKFAFYASNASMTYATTGATVSPANAGVDVVVAYLPYATTTYKVKNNLTFNHIFARIGTVSINAPANYSISNVGLALSAPVSGTYNIKTSTWASKGTATAQTIVASTNDVYVVPGTYSLSVTYTLTRGEYTETFTKSANITLQEGKVNNITATAPTGNAAEIQFTITINPWGTNNITGVTLS